MIFQTSSIKYSRLYFGIKSEVIFFAIKTLMYLLSKHIGRAIRVIKNTDTHKRVLPLSKVALSLKVVPSDPEVWINKTSYKQSKRVLFATL